MKSQYKIKIEEKWTSTYGNLTVGFSFITGGIKVGRCSTYLKSNYTVDSVKLPKGSEKWLILDSMLGFLDAVEEEIRKTNMTDLPEKDWSNVTRKADNGKVNKDMVAAVVAGNKFDN